MNRQQGIQHLLKAQELFKEQSKGFQSWGRVEVQQVALKLTGNEFLLTDKKKIFETISETDIQLYTIGENLVGKVFAAKKNQYAVLITRQEYASQLNEEMPAILDDQAQLLGVSVRKAKNESHVLWALKGRYAAILPNGQCICTGNSLDDAFVAAQLIEKTAKVFFEAKFIGGAKPIHKIEAWLMQQYYRFKYSREAEKNR